MKKYFIHYIKLSFALLLFLIAGKVSGQTSCTVSGVTISATGTRSTTAYVGVPGGCTSSSFTGSGAWTASSGFVVYTFSLPVISARVAYTVVDGGSAANTDIGTITTNGGGTVTLSNACNLSISGTVVAGLSTSTSARDTQVTVTSTQPFTTITLTNTGGKSGFVQGQLCNFTFTPCNAGTTAPTLSATTIANACPVGTVNLDSLVSSATPSGASRVWYTNNTRTGSPVATPTAVSASGTYYAFYYDDTNNCYSPASGAVTATVTLCPVNISNTCPASSVDLTNSFTGSIPLGYDLTFHSATPATTANKIDKIVTTPGTYYGAYFLSGQNCYTATGRPLVVTITACCAAQTAPNLTN